MADGAVPNDGHGGAPSNYGQDNNAQERQSIGALRDRRCQRGLVPAPDEEHPANARNLTQLTGTDAQADVRPGVRVGTDAANVGSASGAVHVLDVVNVGGNLVAVIHAGVGVIADAGGVVAGQAPAQPNLGGVAPAGQAPAQINLGVVAPANQVPAQLNLGGVVLAGQAPAQLNLGGVAPASQAPAQPIPRGVAPVGQVPAQLNLGGVAPAGQAPPQINLGVVAPAGQAPAQLNLGGVAPAGQPPANPAVGQQIFDIEAGLSGPPRRRSEVGSFF